LFRIKKILFSKVNINTTNRKFYLVAFSVFVGYLLLNIFEPFWLYDGNSKSRDDVFVELSIAMFTAFVVMLLCEFVIRELFKWKNMTFVQLVFWFLFEALLVSIFWLGIEIIEKKVVDDLLDVWLLNAFGFVLIMVFPYFAYIIYIRYLDEINSLRKIQAKQAVDQNPEKEFVIKDENEKNSIILNTQNLVYIKSADNYVDIVFIERESVKSTLIRNTIKNLEPLFRDSVILRCHRSYIVNTSFIQSAKKTSTGFMLNLKQVPDKEIPVSKSYSSEISKFL